MDGHGHGDGWLLNRLIINNHLEKYLQKTNERIAINLINIFNLGPLVSFNGSPTVSPITAAL